MRNKFLKKISIFLGCSVMLNTAVPVMAKSNDFFGEYPTGEILSFGSSLNSKQEASLRSYFKAPDDIDVIYVDTEMARKQLGLYNTASPGSGGGWYSSAYVKLKKKGGINVTADKLTLVTDDMLSNALITSGILNADIIASAPFNVTGESALAGILAGAEKIMGGEISQENKEVAQGEIETTLEVAEEIGQKEASTIMNEIKADVIEDSPTTNVQIRDIVTSVVNNYNVNLSENAQDKIVETMTDINDLDIDYDEVKTNLKDVSEKLFDDLEVAVDKGQEVTMKLKESGVLDKIWSWVKNTGNLIVDIFKVATEDKGTDVETNDNIDTNANEEAENASEDTNGESTTP